MAKFWIRSLIRYLIAFGGLAAFGGLTTFSNLKMGDYPIFGLTFKPRQGWVFWLKIGMAALLFIGLSIIAVWFTMKATNHKPIDIFWKFDSPKRFWRWWLPTACLTIPLLEELIYRLFLINVLRAYLKPLFTILLAGGIFSLLHVVYGAAAPENIIGGFLLSWAFLKSESITVPIFFHIAGNLAAGLTHYPI